MLLQFVEDHYRHQALSGQNPLRLPAKARGAMFPFPLFMPDGKYFIALSCLECNLHRRELDETRFFTRLHAIQRRRRHFQ